MTESEWLSATDPGALADFLQMSRTVSDRKLRLYAVACCRAISHLLTDPRSREAVDTAERYAERRATESAMYDAADVAWDATEALVGAPARYAAEAAASCVGLHEEYLAQWHTGRLAALALEGEAVAAGSHPEHRERVMDAWVEAHLDSGRPVGWGGVRANAGVVALIRDVFANPFAPRPRIDPSWLTWNDGTVRRIAGAIYEKKAFERMPILADALLDAGSTTRTSSRIAVSREPSTREAAGSSTSSWENHEGEALDRRRLEQPHRAAGDAALRAGEPPRCQASPSGTNRRHIMCGL